MDVERKDTEQSTVIVETTSVRESSKSSSESSSLRESSSLHDANFVSQCGNGAPPSDGAGSSCIGPTDEKAWALSQSSDTVSASALLLQRPESRDCLLRIRDRTEGRVGDGGPGDWYYDAPKSEWYASSPEDGALYGRKRAWTSNPVADNTTLLFIVLTCYDAKCRELREAIRATWLSAAYGVPHLSRRWTYRFVLGYPPDVSTRRLIGAESEVHGDILFVPMLDAYKNLSVKVSYAMRWACENTSAAYVAKTDDDSYIRSERLAQSLFSSPYDPDAFLGSDVIAKKGSAIRRSGKWSTPIEDFSLDEYLWSSPNGALYVLGRNRACYHALEARKIAERGDVACLPNEDMHNGLVNFLYSRNYTIGRVGAHNRCRAQNVGLGHKHPSKKMVGMHSNRNSKRVCNSKSTTVPRVLAADLRCTGTNGEKEMGSREKKLFANLVAFSKAVGNVPFFLTAGTLLGWYRDCRILPQTTDVDVGIRIGDRPRDFLSRVTSSGFKLKYSFGTASRGLEHSFVRDGLKLDVFFVYEEKASIEISKASRGLVSEVGERLEWWALSKDNLMKKLYAPFCGLAWTKLYGLEVRVPACPELYLKWFYGPEWTKPKTRYSWWKDRHNDFEIIDRKVGTSKFRTPKRTCDGIIFHSHWDGPTLPERYAIALESIFFHCTAATVLLYSNTMPLSFSSPFARSGYDLRVVRYNVTNLLTGIPGTWDESAIERCESAWKSGVNFFSDFLRYVVVWNRGGVWSDIDGVWLRKPPLDGDWIVKTTRKKCPKYIECLSDESTSYISAGIFFFTEARSPYLSAALSRYPQLLDPNIWGSVGPGVMTAAYHDASASGAKMPLRISGANAFGEENHIHAAKSGEWWEAVQNRSLTQHLYGKVTQELTPEEGSIFSQALQSYRVLSNKDVVKKQR